MNSKMTFKRVVNVKLENNVFLTLLIEVCSDPVIPND